MGKPRIRLWGTRSLGLILLREMGVIVENQTDGVACHRSEAEGIYIPLQIEAQEIERFFSRYGNIDDAAADFLDKYFQRDEHRGLRFLSVDRTRLNESLEAWVYVKVAHAEGEARIGLIEGFEETNGILTWWNSD